MAEAKMISTTPKSSASMAPITAPVTSRGSAWPASSTAAPCTSFVPASPNITSAPTTAPRTATSSTNRSCNNTRTIWAQLPRGQALATFAGLETLDGQALATFRLPA
jgi:hypothetical protein